ncbi:MAG: 2-C-methyl-D-erythritol 4-phosphate cytidylyltransferase [Gracilibacteraceae bacterium]|jgi:2-C-methyl-D-erythritol 4-phosphate cytidylyltransferase|nr:2-C-methyl-D-erythritol 4-phosphate cytidylyltransferase [Gracilibacteraceae bacterium]
MDIERPETAAVIPAGGRGRRMGGPGNKLFLPLLGVPILARTLLTFEICAAVDSVLVPVAAEDREALRRLTRTYGLTKTVIAEGGAERRFSVRNALRLLGPSARRVVVHDGARPLLTERDLSLFLLESRHVAAAVAAVPVKDTIKEAEDGWVKATLPRRALRAVQTPQVFARDLLTAAHEAAADDLPWTDDAALVEYSGVRVRLLPGWEENIKITTRIDLLAAEAILRERAREGRA